LRTWRDTSSIPLRADSTDLQWCLNSKNNGRGDCNTRWSLVLELMRGIGRVVCGATPLCNRMSVKKMNVGHSDLLSSRRHTRSRYDVIDLGNVGIKPNMEPELEYMHLKLTNEGVIIARNQTLFDGTPWNSAVQDVIDHIKEGADTTPKLERALKKYYNICDVSQLFHYIFLMKYFGNVLTYASQQRWIALSPFLNKPASRIK